MVYIHNPHAIYINQPTKKIFYSVQNFDDIRNITDLRKTIKIFNYILNYLEWENTRVFAYYYKTIENDNPAIKMQKRNTVAVWDLDGNLIESFNTLAAVDSDYPQMDKNIKAADKFKIKVIF